MEQASIISKVFESHNVRQRDSDGYLSATDMCKIFGKKYNHYSENKSTTEYIQALESDSGIPASQLIEVRKGNSSNFEQGTWVHPMVATHLAQWLSPKFAIQVNKWVIRYLSGDPTLIKEVIDRHDSVNGGKTTTVTIVDEDMTKLERVLQIKERLFVLEQEMKALDAARETDMLMIAERKQAFRRREAEDSVYIKSQLELLKSDPQIYQVVKNNLINWHMDAAVPALPSSDSIIHNKDLSTLAYEATGRRLKNTELAALGKRVKLEYRRRYNTDPVKSDKHVNGAIRGVYLYAPKDYDWITAIICT